MSNIDNASQTNQSMKLHLFIKVDINYNQISKNNITSLSMTLKDGGKEGVTILYLKNQSYKIKC
jgi:hypothetical protein